MLALFCLLSRSASQSGSGVGKGGLSGCVGPFALFSKCSGSLQASNSLTLPLLGRTHSQQFEPLESLSRDHGDHIHFTEKAHF